MDILSHKKSPPLRFIYCNEREGDLGTPVLYFFQILFSKVVILRYPTPIAYLVSGWIVYPDAAWGFQRLLRIPLLHKYSHYRKGYFTDIEIPSAICVSSAGASSPATHKTKGSSNHINAAHSPLATSIASFPEISVLVTSDSSVSQMTS